MTQKEFEKLLACLDADRDAAGVRYNNLLERLVAYFRFKGHSLAEDAADETFDRAAAKLIAGEIIRDIESYCFGIARLIFMEEQRKQARKLTAINVLKEVRLFTVPVDERIYSLMRRCLERLPANDRDLIAGYFVEARSDELKKIRNGMATSLNMTINALRLRIHRVRDQLESCYKAGVRLLE